MKIQLLFFGMSRDLAGTGSMPIELDQPVSIKEFRRLLEDKIPAFSAMDTFSIAVNESYAEEAVMLSDRDTVAIIPPVSGG